MEKIEYILSVAGTVIGLLATTLTFLIKFIKSAKAKKAAETVLKLSTSVIPFIEQAETFLHFSGDEKKQYVMTKINQFAIENNLNFDAEQVSNFIETFIASTKGINAKPTQQQVKTVQPVL